MCIRDSFKGDDNCYYEKVGSATKNITDEIPFDIPDSWSWARIDEIFQHNTCLLYTSILTVSNSIRLEAKPDIIILQ